MTYGEAKVVYEKIMAGQAAGSYQSKLKSFLSEFTDEDGRLVPTEELKIHLIRAFDEGFEYVLNWHDGTYA